MIKGGINKEQTLKTKFTMNLSHNRIIIDKKKTNKDIKVKRILLQTRNINNFCDNIGSNIIKTIVESSNIKNLNSGYKSRSQRMNSSIGNTNTQTSTDYKQPKKNTTKPLTKENKKKKK